MKIHAIIICLLLVGAGAAGYLYWQLAGDLPEQPKRKTSAAPELSKRQLFEAKLKKAGKLLILNEIEIEPDVAALEHRLTASTLTNHALYLRDPDSEEFLFVEGPESKASGETVQVEKSVRLITTPQETILITDGTPLQRNLHGWVQYWVADKASKPELSKVAHLRREVRDGFMRQNLLAEGWTISTGNWQMQQHGGGMPQTEEQMESYSFQRAVNPFSVTGTGILTYENGDWFNALAEARFYFGTPWEGGAVDKNTLPVGTNYMIGVGPAKSCIAFGWLGRIAAFAIAKRTTDGDFKVLKRYEGKRPPISNWVRIGLANVVDYRVDAYLDGEKVLSLWLDQELTGPMHVIAGDDPIEFDNFAVTSLPRSEAIGAPLFVKSRNFSGKREKDKSDPDEFAEWAKGESIFLRTVNMTEDSKYLKAAIFSRFPLMNDFQYTSIPHDDEWGDLPFGLYQFELLRNTTDGLPVYKDLAPIWHNRFLYTEEGWLPAPDQDLRISDQPTPTLKIRRLHENDNRIEVQINDKWQPVSYGVHDPLHIAVVRLLPTSARPRYPRPEHHEVVSASLYNELFEDAATEWSWIDGGFRMDTRWACQERWNFMACGSAGVPMIVSKRRFSGDQEHEFFMSLRPMFPSDGGDPQFAYDRRLHRKQFRNFNGWYNKHDLNFSFCTNGRDPLSGYALVFGGNDNRETLLLRQGKVVDSTTKYRFPESNHHHAVHWKWWQFHVRRHGGRIMIFYDDQLLFDYYDAQPIEGGHIAFWTVRNGFTIAKVVSNAQKIERVPDVLYVAQDNLETDWQPLLHDGAEIQAGDSSTVRITATTGSGAHAARYQLLPPVLLAKTPILDLPLHLSDNVKVNLHLEIDDRSYVIEVNAPLNASKVLLTPQYEPNCDMTLRRREDIERDLRKNEVFQTPVMPETKLRKEHLLTTVDANGTITLNLLQLLREKGYNGPGILRSITIGNSSNANYLLAGSSGNTAGEWYEVGRPEFRSE